MPDIAALPPFFTLKTLLIAWSPRATPGASPYLLISQLAACIHLPETLMPLKVFTLVMCRYRFQRFGSGIWQLGHYSTYHTQSYRDVKAPLLPLMGP